MGDAEELLKTQDDMINTMMCIVNGEAAGATRYHQLPNKNAVLKCNVFL